MRNLTRIRATVFVTLAGAALLSGAAIRDAEACGGCFHPPTPPGQPVSVITDHRMIFVTSPQQTTLYDQIRYDGDPAEFAWVLPIGGAATVGLSSDAVFSTIDQFTQTTVEAPPVNCPPAPSSCTGNSTGFASGGADGDNAAPGAHGGVTVTKQQTVGPYETVQLHATDSNALTDWLTSHSYAIGDDVKPVIAAYVSEHFDFLAMKLVPGQGVHSMRPVRVSTAGASLALPLRMVAAGTGAQVGITLFVIADGRYEPENMASFRIQDADIVWDWNASASNYTALRQSAEQSASFAAWEIESSTSQQQLTFKGAIQGTVNNLGGGPTSGPDYPPTPADDAGVPGATSDQLLEEDLSALFAGVGQSFRVTRMRADLAHAALAHDLLLQASSDQSVLPNIRQAKKEANEPLCPVYQGCQVVGQAPRSEAAARMSATGSTFSCAASPRVPALPFAIGGAFATFGIIVIGMRKRRT